MDFFFLAFVLQLRKILTSFVYLRIELVGIAKNRLIFLAPTTDQRIQ